MDKCKATVDWGTGRTCSRKAVKDGWCKQHWMHPFYAIWSEKVSDACETLPKCGCAWGDVCSPATSYGLSDRADETEIGSISISCIDCDTATGFMPVGSDGDVAALCAAWVALVEPNG